MKTKITIATSILSLKLFAQTITYANFSNALTSTISVNIADNSSYNTALSTTTGNGVTWNASALLVQSGTPVVHLSFGNPASTPQASLYPTSNYVEYDPALTSIISYNYSIINADSVTSVGSYDPSSAHEIFQNPDKHLIFPFAYGQSFTDTYNKTNYSNATTISSYQNGSRTVSFNGFGTLILPQGTFNNVALITEIRTNNLGPNSYEYTWYDISNGRKLLFRSENNGSIITVWSSGVTAGIKENQQISNVTLFPNPMNEEFTVKIQTEKILNGALLKLYNVLGEEIKTVKINSINEIINAKDITSGVIYYNLLNNGTIISSGKLIKE